MTHRRLSLFAAGLLGLTLCIPSPVLARSASCLIKASGVSNFRGPCDFVTNQDGSFAVRARGSRPFVKNIDQILVSVIKRGRADVRGLTKSGINSRWGSARRSRKDRACWVGSDFKVCVW